MKFGVNRLTRDLYAEGHGAKSGLAEQVARDQVTFSTQQLK